MAVFLKIAIDEAALRRADARETLVDLCPVNVFRLAEAGAITVDDERVDECTLCGLCSERFPGVVRVEKLY